MHKVLYADELAAGAELSDRSKTVQTKIVAEYPTYVGMLASVTYNDKRDCYVAKFDNAGTAISLKMTNEGANFLLTETGSSARRMRPTVYVRLAEDGFVQAVGLLYLGRD